MERRLCCTRGRRRERGPRCQPYARHSRRQGATHELCHDLVHWRLRRPLNTTSNLDRGPLTTPKPLPAYRATAAPPRYHSPPKQLSPAKPTGPALRLLCTGDHRSPPYTKQTGSGTTTTPKALLAARRSCHCRPSETTGPSETKGHSQRTRCVHSHKLVPSLPVFTPFLPRFYPVFTPFLPRSAPFLPHFYPSFTPFLPCSASSFYPAFTPFLPSFYPVPLRRFYPRFTPFLPHLRRVKCQTYPVFTPLLPHRQFLPSQAFYPGFTPFLVLCACRFPRFYPRGKTAHFLLVIVMM